MHQRIATSTAAFMKPMKNTKPPLRSCLAMMALVGLDRPYRRRGRRNRFPGFAHEFEVESDAVADQSFDLVARRTCCDASR